MAPVSTGPSALVRELANTAPDWPFPSRRLPGRLAPAGRADRRQGKRLTDNLESWAETELATRQGDLGWLARTTPNKGCWPPGWWAHPLSGGAGWRWPGGIFATGNRRITGNRQPHPVCRWRTGHPGRTARPATARSQRPSAGPAVLCVPPRQPCWRLFVARMRAKHPGTRPHPPHAGRLGGVRRWPGQ